MSSIPISGGFKPVRPEMENMDKELRKASKLYEKQFLREMVKSMRSTVSHSGMTEPSMAEKIFREKLDHEYVESWGDTGGVGLGEIIYSQLKERFFSDKLINQPAGPIPLNKEGTIFKVDETKEIGVPVTNESVTPQKDMSMLLELPKGETNRSVTSPWDGEVSQAFADAQGRQTLRVDHDNGLVSTIHFAGSAQKFKSGDLVKQGQVLGNIAPDNGNVSWRLVQVENS